MEKKVMDTLHAMLCGEIEDIAKKGTLSHETLDVLKDLVETEKNLEKIKKYKKEEEMEWGMDQGYSQRKYYIDADYDPYSPHMSYARGGRAMDGNSYSYRDNRIYDGGRSYAGGMYYDPRYDMRGGMSYAGGSKTEMVEELKHMMNETSDNTVKNAIQDAIAKMNK